MSARGAGSAADHSDGGRAARDDEDAKIAAARAYVDALVTHDATAVGLTRDAVRYEAGVKTGWSGAHIRRSLERGPQFRVIGGVRGFEAQVDGARVRTSYTIDTAVAGRNFVIAEVSEDFTISPGGAIRRIDARIRPRLGPDAPGRRGRAAPRQVP